MAPLSPPANRPAPLYAKLARHALGCTLATLAMVAPARAQFSVNPVIMQFSGTAQLTEVVQISNEGTEEMQFRLYVGDFDQAEDGDHTFLAPGEHPRSCSKRVRFYPEAVSLRPGEQQAVRVQMEPGAQTCWSLLFVESMVRTASGIYAQQRIGVKVYGVAPTARVDGELTGVEVEKEEPGLDVTLEFRSSGEAPLRPEGKVEIRTYSGEVVAETDVEPFSVLPGYLRRTTVQIKRSLSPGRYLVVPILDFGGEYLAAGQAGFQVN